MTETHGAAGVADGAAGSSHQRNLDAAAAAQSQEFQELIRKRRRFVVPATVFFLAWYFGFIVLSGYAEDFMGETFITDGLTVGYALALTQFVMVWGLTWLYLRKSDREFDPLARRAAERALELSREPKPADAGRPPETGPGKVTPR
jgi:uncharacterized membrane protein (DUF485 family)